MNYQELIKFLPPRTQSAPSSTAKHANVGKTSGAISTKRRETPPNKEAERLMDMSVILTIILKYGGLAVLLGFLLWNTKETFVSIKGISKTGGELIRYAWISEGGGLWGEMTGECRREENMQEAELLDDREAEMAQTRE